jgi:hypothetical protein
MNDPFEKKVRAAAVSGWWVVLIAVAFLTLLWLLYLAVAAYLVGAGRRLAFRPERVVLGRGGAQVLRLAPGVRYPLVDAVGEAVAEAGPARGEMTIPDGGHGRPWACRSSARSLAVTSSSRSAGIARTNTLPKGPGASLKAVGVRSTGEARPQE